MKKIRLTALLLALTGVLLAGCHGAAAPEKPAEAADVAGADWRTWGWIDDAKQSYASMTLLDQNGDGSADVRLVFLHEDGTQTELVWCRSGEEFALAPALAGAAE